MNVTADKSMKKSEIINLLMQAYSEADENAERNIMVRELDSILDRELKKSSKKKKKKSLLEAEEKAVEEDDSGK